MTDWHPKIVRKVDWLEGEIQVYQDAWESFEPLVSTIKESMILHSCFHEMVKLLQEASDEIGVHMIIVFTMLVSRFDIQVVKTLSTHGPISGNLTAELSVKS